MNRLDPYTDENFLQEFLEGSYWLDDGETVDAEALSDEEFTSILDGYQERYDACWYEAVEDSQGSVGSFTTDDYEEVLAEIDEELHRVATWNIKQRSVPNEPNV